MQHINKFGAIVDAAENYAAQNVVALSAEMLDFNDNKGQGPHLKMLMQIVAQLDTSRSLPITQGMIANAAMRIVAQLQE